MILCTFIIHNYWKEGIGGKCDDISIKEPVVGATTGERFSGDIIRKYPSSDYMNLGIEHGEESILGDRSISCTKWCVLTTIFPPSEAIRHQVKLKGWCLVIVTDNKTPQEYETGWIQGSGNDHVVLLTVEEQKEFVNDFVQMIQWNHFGRKNIGYLYAIQHGAEVIWDFDDDNMLKKPDSTFFDAEASNGIGEKDVAVRIPHQLEDCPTYNPYPVLGAPFFPSWPRGLPLQHIQNTRCYNASLKNIKVKRNSIGVLQSLADIQPDVDAIYRLTMKIPFSFNHLIDTRPLLVPRGVLTPFNAQATFHFKDAFWGLLLPIAVNGRVSDIWRSYIVGRLFWDCGLHFGFLAQPLVVQDRNPHDNIKDMSAEDDLYKKGEQLVSFLGEWKSSAQTLEERIQELWIALYERQYIEKRDVVLVQRWLSNLKRSGYKFPKPTT